MEELQIQDIEFLYGSVNPTIILIYQDNHGRHIKTQEISLKEKEFTKVGLSIVHIFYYELIRLDYYYLL